MAEIVAMTFFGPAARRAFWLAAEIEQRKGANDLRRMGYSCPIPTAMAADFRRIHQSLERLAS